MSDEPDLPTGPPAAENPIPGLLPLLRRQGRLPTSAAERAARVARLPAERHEAALLAEGLLTEEDIAQAVAQDCGLPFRAINPAELNAEVVTGVLPAPFARRHTMCALSKEGDLLTVAVANPYERSAIADLERYLGVRVEVVVATRSDIEGINGSLYNLRTSLRAAETELTHDHGAAGPAPGTQEFVSASEAAGDLEPTTRPVVAALDSILHQAFEQRASDIHLEPKRDRAVVRFRVDGVLRTMHTFPRIVYQAVVSRLKMLSGLDIAEKRRPQDGRFKRIEPDNEIELRVSTLPTVFGEKAVLRVFDPSALVSSLEQLRLAEDEEARLRAILERREGLVLVTGPTGSGKTTTLYSVLRHVATPEVNVITIEDPVELIHPPLSQVQVNPRIDLSFAAAIRSVLRQDPDIVMVGEIRDGETAGMAVQAALTGHLVLSTLHTNDAPSAVTRLADLGVPRFLIGTTLVGVLAQRLVRTICPRCAAWTALSGAEAATVAIPELAGRRVRRGSGCARCRETGYRGRRGVFEILPVDAEAAAHVLRGGNAEDLARLARRRGCRSLRQSAIRLLLEGETSLAEVVRVTGAGLDPGSREGLGAIPAPAAPKNAPASPAERPADQQEQGGRAVEETDDIGERGRAVPDREGGEAPRRPQRNLPDLPEREDQPDPDQIEEEMDHRQLESPMGVRAGDGERGEKGGHRGPDIGAQGHREGVVEEQKAGAGERDEHRSGHRTGLHQDGGQGADRHRQKRSPAEDAVDGLLGAPGGEALEGAHEQGQGEHEQRRRTHRQNRGGGLVRSGDPSGGPLDGRRNDLDEALEGALVLETGAGEPPEEIGDEGRGPRQGPGGDLDRQQHGDRQQVEHVVAGGHREGPTQLLPIPEVAEGGEGVGDGGAHIGAHDHRDRALEGQRGPGSGDEAHDQGAGDRGTLQQGGGEHPDQQPHEGVLRSLEEAVEQPGAESLEALAEPVDRAEKDGEEGEQREEAGRVTREATAENLPAGHQPFVGRVAELAAAGWHESVCDSPHPLAPPEASPWPGEPTVIPGPSASGRSRSKPEGPKPVFRFEMDE